MQYPIIPYILIEKHASVGGYVVSIQLPSLVQDVFSGTYARLVDLEERVKLFVSILF